MRTSWGACCKAISDHVLECQGTEWPVSQDARTQLINTEPRRAKEGWRVRHEDGRREGSIGNQLCEWRPTNAEERKERTMEGDAEVSRIPPHESGIRHL